MSLCAVAFYLRLSIDICAPLVSGGSIEYWATECRRGVRFIEEHGPRGIRRWYSCGGHTWWMLDEDHRHSWTGYTPAGMRKYKYDPSTR